MLLAEDPILHAAAALLAALLDKAFGPRRGLLLSLAPLEKGEGQGPRENDLVVVPPKSWKEWKLKMTNVIESDRDG